MNIARAFVTYMEGLGLGTFGTDIFIGAAPVNATDPLWWVITSGGASQPQNDTGERLKDYTLSIYYRSTDAQDVYDQLQDFEEEVNSNGCATLDDFDVVDMSAISFATDQDLDAEDRTVGLVQVRVRVYQSV